MSATKSTIVSDPRQQRGMHIAATAKLRRKGDLWAVPSQSGDDPYTVDMRGAFPRCTCPDHLMRRAKCKHIHAVEYTIRRETAPDGTTTVSKTVKVTYRQDWPAYNAAQTHEAERLPELLHGLCQGIVQPQQTKGRPRLPLADVVFAAVLKVYGTMSGRRSAGDLTACLAKGYLTRIPSYNSLFDYLDDPDLTPILKALIEESASPLKAVETDFAVDASGFTTSKFERWYNAKSTARR